MIDDTPSPLPVALARSFKPVHGGYPTYTKEKTMTKEILPLTEFAIDSATLARIETLKSTGKKTALEQIAARVDEIKRLYNEVETITEQFELDTTFYLGDDEDHYVNVDRSPGWQSSSYRC